MPEPRIELIPARADEDASLQTFDLTPGALHASPHCSLHSPAHQNHTRRAVLYILTNERSTWFGGWRTGGEQGLVRDVDRADVGMAVDIEIVRRAAVFLRNGVFVSVFVRFPFASAFSLPFPVLPFSLPLLFMSNVVITRLLNGREALTVWFR
ncbi:hypothetical protein B0H17DRAFT_1209842 [Mycena rosella]|uniref:Uncharacterized protein n=1 Tax=Mycena rosella TaxID=1033263 RepID=A0AAD7CXF1_MYCRO|nr:hypothetical protein B0H17DRAFT_1209842 [Mycena rosella]